MKPITHAKIRYWSYTIIRLPKILFLAAQGGWYGWRKNDEAVAGVWEQVNQFMIDREYETRRTFRFHRDGYELVMRVK